MGRGPATATWAHPQPHANPPVTPFFNLHLFSMKSGHKRLFESSLLHSIQLSLPHNHPQQHPPSFTHTMASSCSSPQRSLVLAPKKIKKSPFVHPINPPIPKSEISSNSWQPLSASIGLDIQWGRRRRAFGQFWQFQPVLPLEAAD